jgi:hypothetical protein
MSLAVRVTWSLGYEKLCTHEVGALKWLIWVQNSTPSVRSWTQNTKELFAGDGGGQG